ncbi:MAG: hypothetical protein R2736_13915 [Solirubrobacterales bacterium]
MPIFEIVFQQALADRLDDVALGRVGIGEDSDAADAALHLSSPSCQLVDGVERRVQVDRAAAVADQRRHVVDLARLAGLQHERALQAVAARTEVMVDSGRAQRQDRHAATIRQTRQDQHVHALAQRDVGLRRRSRPAGRVSHRSASTGQVMSTVCVAKMPWPAS